MILSTDKTKIKTFSGKNPVLKKITVNNTCECVNSLIYLAYLMIMTKI